MAFPAGARRSTWCCVAMLLALAACANRGSTGPAGGAADSMSFVSHRTFQNATRPELDATLVARCSLNNPAAACTCLQKQMDGSLDDPDLRSMLSAMARREGWSDADSYEFMPHNPVGLDYRWYQAFKACGVK
jgi:hypothetical protein